LLLGNTRDVVEQLTKGDTSFHLDEYLQTREVQKARSFGASLRISDWAVGGTTTVARTRKEQRDIDGRLRLSLDGRKSYKAQWNKDVEEYGFDLSAAMEGFAAAPKGKDFQLRIGLSWMWKDQMSPRLAETIADVATVWRIVEVAHRDRVQDALQSLQGRVQADLELAIDDAGVRRLAETTEPELQRAWKVAMAEALPLLFFNDRTFRPTLKARKSTYSGAADQLFSQVSETEIVTGLKYKKGEELLRIIDLEMDLGKPNSISNPFVPFSVKELWQRGDRHPERCKRAFRALSRLRGFLDDGDPAEFQDAFRTLQGLLGQAYTARLIGSVLAQLLADHPESISATGKVVSVAGAEAIVIA
jgi:hypothetical protein